MKARGGKNASEELRRINLSRLSIEQLRRQELARAAYEILQEEGIAGTTLAKVAERAGMSKGIVLHYFKGKDELLARKIVPEGVYNDIKDGIVARQKN